MKQTLTIPEWHAMAQAGNAVPMRILIHGGSMYPLIRMDRDYVTIMPLKEKITVGDIVMFSDPRRERYVLHRVWRIEGNKVLTWGDNCRRPDPWMPMDAIWGKATLIERGKKRIVPRPARGVRMARIWHPFSEKFRCLRELRTAIRIKIKRIFSRS